MYTSLTLQIKLFTYFAKDTTDCECRLKLTRHHARHATLIISHFLDWNFSADAFAHHNLSRLSIFKDRKRASRVLIVCRPGVLYVCVFLIVEHSSLARFQQN